MTAYIALLRKDLTSDYGVDFPGCVTAGETLEEARSMAAEALGPHVQGILEDREAIPEPSSLDAIMENRENREAVAFLVDVASRDVASRDVASRPAKTVRVNVMLPEDLAKAIDRTTRNRSRFLAEAARSKLYE